MSEILEYLSRILDFVFGFLLKYFWFVVVAYIALKFLYRKSAHKKMQEIALKLGLQFAKRSRSTEIEESFQKQTTEVPKILVYIGKALEFVAPLVSPWEMKGKWNDIPVCVYPDVSEKKGRLTIVRADREDAKAIGLTITAAAILNRILGSDDITSGNEEFDKMLYVFARNPDQAKMLLMNPNLQDAILQAVKFNKSINIEDQHVTFVFPGVLTDEQKLRAALDHVSRTALALRSASR